MALRAVDESYLREREAIDAEEARDDRGLKASDGGGTSTPVVDSDLKPRVDWLYTLIPWLIGLIVTIFLAILVSAATTNGRIDKVGETTSALNREVGTVSTKVDDANKRLDRIDAKLDRIEGKLDAIGSRLPR